MKRIAALFLLICGLARPVLGQEITAADTARIRAEVLDTEFSSLEQIDTLLKFDPKQWDIWLRLATRQVYDDAIEDAQTSMNKVLEFAPEPEKARALVIIANTALAKPAPNLSFARYYTDRAIEIDSNSWIAHFTRAHAFLLDSTYKEVEPSIKKAIELVPPDEDDETNRHTLNMILGFAMHKNGNSDAGLALIEKTMNEMNGAISSDAYLVRSEVFDDRKNGQNAIEDLQYAFDGSGDMTILKKKIQLRVKYGDHQTALAEAVRYESAAVEMTSFVNDIAAPLKLPLAQSFDLKKGTKLTYCIDNSYDMTVVFDEVSSKKVKFSYVFSNAPETTGMIEVSGRSLSNAHGYMSYFGFETRKTPFLKDTTTMILSKEVYENLQNGKTASITMDDAEGRFVLEKKKESKPENTELIVELNGKWVRLAIDQFSDESNILISTVKNAQIPLMLHVNLNIAAPTSIRLVKIE